MRKINLQPEDTLYILGDVIDRFPDGIKMIRQFMKMPNVKMLLGNHEHMMLEALYYPIVVKKPWDNEDYVRQDKLKLWYYNGGDITHYYLKHIRKAIRQEVFEFLSNLPLNIHVEVNGQKYLLIHGGVEANFEQNNYKHDDKVTYDHIWGPNTSGCGGSLSRQQFTPAITCFPAQIRTATVTGAETSLIMNIPYTLTETIIRGKFLFWRTGRSRNLDFPNMRAFYAVKRLFI